MTAGLGWIHAALWLLVLNSSQRTAVPDCAELRDRASAVITATQAGRSADAIAAATELAEATRAGPADDCRDSEAAPAYLHLTLARFGRWDELLSLSPPASDHVRARALASYARGVALAATGRWEEARLTLRALRETAFEGSGVRDPVIQIAVHALGGELSLRHGQPGDAVVLFERAVRLQDELPARAPPAWHYPLRHSLGAALLAAGRPREAETAYRRSLERYPENGWSLYGLIRALEEQGRIEEAASIRRRFEAAWRGADVEAPAERL